MFSTHSPYSPFFTSGLLSSFDRPRIPDVPLSPRRGSLPTDGSLREEEEEEETAAFYFTLQARRDEDEFRSFLSLDLAESQSMRSASIKRKASTSTRSRSTRTDSVKPFRFPQIPEVPGPQSTPLRMRFSRDSLRTIPSPKPAPSITLPELPKPTTSSTASTSASTSASSSSPAPRLPSIPVIPAIELNLTSPRMSKFASPTATRCTPSRGAPYPLSQQRPAPPARLNLNFNLNRVSIATKASSSTVSTRARKYNRSEALARLEGRVPPMSAPLPSNASTTASSFFTSAAAPGVNRPLSKRNFMSMSDDEYSSSSDDDEDDASDTSSLNSSSDASSNLDFAHLDSASELDALDFPDLALHTLDPFLEPEDMVLPFPAPNPSTASSNILLSFPLPSPSFLEVPRSAPLPPSSTTARSGFLDVAHPMRHQQRSSTLELASLRRKRTRAAPAEHLHSFIDLHQRDSAAPASGPIVYGERKDSLPGFQAKRKPAKKAKERKSAVRKSAKDEEGQGREGRNSWTWRSFIEVANVS